MRLVIASDIHTDHWMSGLDKVCEETGDVLILAGDISSPPNLYNSLVEIAKSKFKHVLYVLGNHDYIRAPSSNVVDICIEVESEYPHVKLLENRSVTIEGKRFHGGTLWYLSNPNPGFFDFRYIPNFNWYKEACQYTMNYMLENVSAGDIIITHHAPSWKSVQPRWRSHEHNKFFVCPEMEEVIEATNPSMYIHGHMHDSFSYHIHKTIVYCHPCGYPGENPGWKPKVLNI